MARFDEVYDVGSLPEGNKFDPLPAGWYSVQVSHSELKDTKNGTGKYISLSYTVFGGQSDGRLIFSNINIRNANPKAEEIGRQQLGELMRATGIARLQDTDQLIGLQLQIKVNIKKDDEYGDKNEVKAYKPLGNAPPVSPVVKSTNAAPSAKAAPWAKPKQQAPPAEGEIPF